MRMFNPVNETTYYAALGESLIVTCQAQSDYRTSVTWRRGHTIVNQSVQHCYNFDINNSSCISPSPDVYKKDRVRSRTFKSEICETHVIITSNLDISIVDWTDNGLSYSCISRIPEFRDVTEEVHIYVVVG